MAWTSSRTSGFPGDRWALGALALLLLAPGCGDEPSEKLAARPPAAPPAATEASLPPLHTVSVEVEKGRASVHSNQALRIAILEELAEQGGFALAVGPVEPAAVTLRLEDVPLSEAISAALGPVPYTAAYTFDTERGTHVLARVSAGEGAGVAAAPAASRVARSPEEAGEPRREQREARRVELIPRSGPRAEEPPELTGDDAELLKQLASPDRARRLEALGQIDAEGAQLPRVIAIAKEDSDPRVRAEAATRLGDAGSFEAVATLLDLLQDPSPEVVVATLEALEFVGDESLLPRVKPLAEHPNPLVREAAQETIDSLE